MSLKTEIRQKQLSYLKSFSGNARADANRKILSTLIENPVVKQAQRICSFVSFRHEVGTHTFIDWIICNKKQAYVPKVIGDRLGIFQIESLTECVPNQMGILEPSSSAPECKLEDIDVFIVPGLAFDVEGFRLGYGKGYYDKLLAQTTTFSIGICFTNQIMFSLPHEQNDIPVKKVITDTIQIF